MSVESIKRLVQCENEAKERLEKARRELEEMRAQARDDARLMVEGLNKENVEKLLLLEKEVEEYIKMVDEKLKQELEMKIRELKNIKNRKNVVSALVEHVSGANGK
ncbi:hypothetical protein [Encephalitozoon cuniculi GB-M1]|uniref:Uncharacterized protein n=2 Tax=Encephalitozoon cuniculi TaxID=6035 RepID=Q8SW99_ENCCU|nr:uncharacterized protein ECU02_1330 [Encephalitozoon cuniculi GB-M1]AGE95637.1 hypothetical protein ECU02_1330 [Encephalitozoon cuniculi]KMV66651.1 hypothetical protein M970_021290 [Encephalitozoon cuniculi EcunIII-L]UYI28326.1 hypothetical protein J0A71_10g22320 [Encephalitozoon cuniculi]CAD25162.1 hypothetical protein [Encephalitozoon cuniculi GB-M1]